MTKDTAKTSTFTVDHGKCDPSKWTAEDVLTLARFVRRGSMVDAAKLARLGLSLVSSEHHAPLGGHLEPIGWAKPDEIDAVFEHLNDMDFDDDVTEVVRVYRGPVEFVARMPIGDEDGTFDGYEYEPCPTQERADRLIAKLYPPIEPKAD